MSVREDEERTAPGDGGDGTVQVRQLEALYAMAETVAGASSLDEILQAGLGALADGLGVERAAILLVDAEGVPRFRAWRGVSDAYRAAVDGHSSWPAGDPDPQPILVPDPTGAAELEPYRTALAREGIEGLAFVPLVYAGELIGKLVLYYSEPHDFTAGELQLAGTVANHIAAATQRKRAERELVESRAELEAMFGGVADGITAQDVSGRLVYANDAAAQLIGFATAQELLEAPLDQLMAGFELLDEQRAPLPLDELPGRIAIRTGTPAERTICYRIRATGQERWSMVRATPVRGEDGAVTMAINTFHDVTDQLRTSERVRFLAETSDILATSLDFEQTLARLGDVIVPALADYCIVDLVEEGAPLRQAVLRHVDPEKQELLRAIRTEYPPDRNPRHPASVVLSSGEPLLIAIADEAALANAARDEHHLELYQGLMPTSYLVAPLVARGRTIGTLSLGTGESGRRYSEDDLAFATDVAARIALGVENARLYTEVQSSYALLDTLLVSSPVAIGFWDRDLRYLRVNDALAEINGLSPEEHVGKRLEEVIPHFAPVLEPLYRSVLETGEPIVHNESTDDSAQALGDRRHWLSSYYPVRSENGEVLGLGAVIMEVTARKRADDRLRLLAEAGELFSSSLDQEEIFARVSRVLVPRVADSLHIFLVNGDRLERVSCAHVDPELVPLQESLPGSYPLGPDAPSFTAAVVEHGEPVLFHDVSGEFYEQLERFGADRAAMERIGSRSVMLIPLVARGVSLGVLSVGSRQPGRYSEEDVALTLELAGRAALAIDNARLFGEVSFRTTLLEAQQEASLDGLLLVSPEGEILSYNRRFSEIWHLSEDVIASGSDEATLVNAVEWVLEPDTFLERVREAYERREVTHDEIYLVDGRTIERHGTPVRGLDGRYHGYLWTFRDVTEARRAERALRDAQATLDAAARAARVGTWYWDVAADVVYADEFISHAFGVDPVAGAAGVTTGVWLDAVNEDDRARVQDALAEVLESGGEYEAEFRVTGRDGQERWVLSRGVVDPDSSGRGARMLGAVADLTERKSDERELERRAQAAQALEFVGDGVFLLDASGIVRIWNPAAAAITGLREAEVVGRPLGLALPGWADVERLIPVAETRHGGGVRAETLPVEIDGREVWLSISGVDFAEGTVYAFRDLTEERGLDRLKSDFVSTVSHELRTPLAAIYGAAMTLRREDVPLTEEQREGMLGVVSGEAERLARIVNDILLASRLDSDVVEVSIGNADAGELAASVVAAAKAHLPANVELRLVVPEELPPIAADADKLRQVLVNLVENGIKYSPDGGTVEVALTTVPGRLRFAVRDEGLGVPVAEQSRIFEKFYRLDPHLTRGVGGTGLGLYICREIVRRMDGRIWVDSQPGAGSTFWFELPLA
ncbi:MAG TPA: PAS domain-containing protein [Gaiellaceae bacterium]|nr:PAS domain-containing protein [Gaiellaceae bacterium]